MDRITVDVNGLEDLLKRLSQRAVKVKRELKAAAMAGAMEFERGQKRRIRVRQGPLPEGRVHAKSTIKSRVIVARATFIRIETGPGQGGRHSTPLAHGHVMSGRFSHLAPAKVRPFPFTGFKQDKAAAESAVNRRLLRAAAG